MLLVCGLIFLFSYLAAGAEPGTTADLQTLKAIEEAQLAVSAAPESESNRIALASLCLKAGQNRCAADTLKVYLKGNPDAPKVLRLLAVAYLREEDYAEANAAAEHALRFSPRDSAGVQVLAMAQLGLQAPGSAERLFREAINLDPRSAEANLQLGLLLTKQRKNLDEAVRLLQKARDLQPNLAGTYAALGSALLESGHARQAVASLETAVKLAPDSAEAYYVLAGAYRQLHEDAAAENALQAFNLRKKADADQRAREMRSRADYEAGVNLLSNTEQLEKAYELLAKAAQERPSWDPAYYRMAQISYLKGDLPSALNSIREALRLNPFEPEYYYVLSRCLQDTDRPAALEAIQKAINLRPGVPDFEDLLRELKATGVQPGHQ